MSGSAPGFGSPSFYIPTSTNPLSDDLLAALTTDRVLRVFDRWILEAIIQHQVPERQVLEISARAVWNCYRGVPRPFEQAVWEVLIEPALPQLIEGRSAHQWLLSIALYLRFRAGLEWRRREQPATPEQKPYEDGHQLVLAAIRGDVEELRRLCCSAPGAARTGGGECSPARAEVCCTSGVLPAPVQSVPAGGAGPHTGPVTNPLPQRKATA